MCVYFTCRSQADDLASHCLILVLHVNVVSLCRGFRDHTSSVCLVVYIGKGAGCVLNVDGWKKMVSSLKYTPTTSYISHNVCRLDNNSSFLPSFVSTTSVRPDSLS